MIQPAFGTMYDCGSLYTNARQFKNSRTSECLEESSRLLAVALKEATERMLAYIQTESDWIPCPTCKGVGSTEVPAPAVEN